MKLGTCCYKALKHGETVCPVCNQTLLPIGIPQQLVIQFKGKQK